MQTGRPPAVAPPIKEEHGDPPPGAQYLSARCVLFTYFQGDISREVDEHFSRALSTGACTDTCMGNSLKALRDGSFPMNQRSFPPSFWSSSFQPSLTHPELSFPSDSFSSPPFHAHEAWHHHYSIGSQGSAFPRPAVHDMYGTAFDPRYSSLLVPTVRSHHRINASSCDLSGKAESESAWGGAFTAADIGLGVDSGLQTQEKSKDLYWF
ncbi:transcription cofactor vestigial-like protein 2a [Gouania willdenowi]|uniref:transcription cofactor vestigial-like protein 2a n=1 Tax=Gouania willdenowi TaxID=441366 RepID=UPI0010569043|nr:transcription cofactor vestigial-like protein 2 [Gouania willdenowi]